MTTRDEPESLSGAGMEPISTLTGATLGHAGGMSREHSTESRGSAHVGISATLGVRRVLLPMRHARRWAEGPPKFFRSFRTPPVDLQFSRSSRDGRVSPVSMEERCEKE
jgi:hypothetical protein